MNLSGLHTKLSIVLSINWLRFCFLVLRVRPVPTQLLQYFQNFSFIKRPAPAIFFNLTYSLLIHNQRVSILVLKTKNLIVDVHRHKTPSVDEDAYHPSLTISLTWVKELLISFSAIKNTFKHNITFVKLTLKVYMQR